jgi:hypothetical protein
MTAGVSGPLVRTNTPPPGLAPPTRGKRRSTPLHTLALHGREWRRRPRSGQRVSAGADRSAITAAPGTYAPPMASTIRPVPEHTGHVDPLASRPDPPHSRHRFSPVPSVPGDASSPGRTSRSAEPPGSVISDISSIYPVADHRTNRPDRHGETTTGTHARRLQVGDSAQPTGEGRHRVRGGLDAGKSRPRRTANHGPTRPPRHQPPKRSRRPIPRKSQTLS